jgi:hypothetical protein
MRYRLVAHDTAFTHHGSWEEADHCREKVLVLVGPPPDGTLLYTLPDDGGPPYNSLLDDEVFPDVDEDDLPALVEWATLASNAAAAASIGWSRRWVGQSAGMAVSDTRWTTLTEVVWATEVLLHRGDVKHTDEAVHKAIRRRIAIGRCRPCAAWYFWPAQVEKGHVGNVRCPSCEIRYLTRAPRSAIQDEEFVRLGSVVPE